MAQQQQRRSLKNVPLTSKYHLAYMGTSIFLSWSLLMMLYGFVIYRFSEMARAGSDFPLQTLIIVATVIATLIGLLILGAAVLAAHRIAGVHIKLQNICNRIKEGELDTRLYFRSTDKLEDVQDSFNSMMDSLQERIEGAAKSQDKKDKADSKAEEESKSEAKEDEKDEEATE